MVILLLVYAIGVVIALLVIQWINKNEIEEGPSGHYPVFIDDGVCFYSWLFLAFCVFVFIKKWIQQ